MSAWDCCEPAHSGFAEAMGRLTGPIAAVYQTGRVPAVIRTGQRSNSRCCSYARLASTELLLGAGVLVEADCGRASSAATRN